MEWKKSVILVLNVLIAVITGIWLWRLIEAICTPRIYELSTKTKINNFVHDIVEKKIHVISNAEGAVLIAIVLGWCGIAITLMNVLSRSDDDR